VGLDDEYPELPTVPSNIQTLTTQIRQLRIEELVVNARKAMEGIQQLVNSPDMKESFGSLNQTLKDLGKLARNVDSKLEPVTSGMEETLKDTRKLVQSLEAQVVPLASSLEQSAASAQAALTQAKEAFAKMEGLTSEDSALVYQLTQALDELSAAARSIRVMASYLERHPEALLRGKAETGGK
jgi:paraquat-inducible protein B